MRRFIQHPSQVGETYAEHMFAAAGFGFLMIKGGVACLVHAVFPWLCQSSGSETIRQLYRRMVANRADAARFREIEESFDWVI